MQEKAVSSDARLVEVAIMHRLPKIKMTFEAARVGLLRSTASLLRRFSLSCCSWAILVLFYLGCWEIIDLLRTTFINWKELR